VPVDMAQQLHPLAGQDPRQGISYYGDAV
jgi:hypothetical protein